VLDRSAESAGGESGVDRLAAGIVFKVLVVDREA
jgi:hypothetical protein